MGSKRQNQDPFKPFFVGEFLEPCRGSDASSSVSLREPLGLSPRRGCLSKYHATASDGSLR